MSNPNITYHMIQKITTQHKINTDPKPQVITLDLKPYFNLQLTASTTPLVSERRTKINEKIISISIYLEK